MVYSTCSISPYENDEVIRKLVTKFKGQLNLKWEKVGEKTEFGHIILPDKENYGPIYFSIIDKIIT